MVVTALLIAPPTSPTLSHTVAPLRGFLASARNSSAPLSLSNPHAQPVLSHVTYGSSAWRASKAAQGVSASTPTPHGMRTILTTPTIALALVSSITSGTDPSTGARKTAP